MINETISACLNYYFLSGHSLKLIRTFMKKKDLTTKELKNH